MERARGRVLGNTGLGARLVKLASEKTISRRASGLDSDLLLILPTFLYP